MADKDTYKAVALVVAFILFSVVFGFLLTGGVVYIGSLIFHYEFSWILVLGCYSILVLLKILLG